MNRANPSGGRREPAVEGPVRMAALIIPPERRRHQCRRVKRVLWSWISTL